MKSELYELQGLICKKKAQQRAQPIDNSNQIKTVNYLSNGDKVSVFAVCYYTRDPKACVFLVLDFIASAKTQRPL